MRTEREIGDSEETRSIFTGGEYERHNLQLASDYCKINVKRWDAHSLVGPIL